MKWAALALIVALACYWLLALALGHAYHWWPLRIVLGQAARVLAGILCLSVILALIMTWFSTKH